MGRPILAVILGTFTLRLATGITGSMLVYYFKAFPSYGGEPVTRSKWASWARCSTRASSSARPMFGVMSDRIGHRRVMLFGPAFGAVAVVITAFTVSLPVHRLHPRARGRVDGGIRPVDPRASSPSPPQPTSSCAAGRSRASRRRRWPDSWPGSCPRGILFRCSARGASWSTPWSTGSRSRSTSSACRSTRSPRLRAAPTASRHGGLGRYAAILRGSHVWLLAPTWIAINAMLGLFTSQTLFQLVQRARSPVRRAAADGRVRARCGQLGLAVGGLLFFPGLLCWGGRFATMRRTTIIFYGILGGAAARGGGSGSTTGTGPAPRAVSLLAVVPSAGCSCSPARPPRRSACSPT